MIRFTFKKEERLCNKKFITKLFNSGSSFVVYPFRVVYLKEEAVAATVQVIISAPKRRFKRAVDRNILKRRMREAYRYQNKLQLYPFLQSNQGKLLLSIQYIGKDILSYSVIFNKMTDVFFKLQKEYAENYLD